MITVLHQYVSAEEFAKRCGVQTRCINERARKKTIDAIKADGYWFINTETTPVIHHRKRKHNPPLMPAQTPLYNGNLKNLRRVPTTAQAKHMLPNSIYEAIILGSLDAVILGNIVYIDSTDPNLQKFYGKQQ